MGFAPNVSGKSVTDGKVAGPLKTKRVGGSTYVALLGIIADVVRAPPHLLSSRLHQPTQPNSCASQARSQCFS
jgi:hypothetical protein